MRFINYPLLAFGAFASVLGGCDAATDPVEPAPRVAVHLSAATTDVGFRPEERGTRLHCTLALTATASGTSGASAVWEAATLRLYAGPEGATLLEIVRLSQAEVQGAWFSEQIGPGQAQSGTLTVSGDGPFTVRGELDFREAGAATSAAAGFDATCDPGPAAVGGADPWIRDIYVEPASGEIEPSHTRTMKVTYTAVPGDGGVGIVESGVRLSGGLDTVLRRTEATSMGRVNTTLTFEVFTTAEHGEKIRLQVYSIDAFGRQIATDWIDGPTVVDRTPPVVVQANLHSSPPPAGSVARFVGTYASSDTLHVFLWASDNHRLAQMAYSLGPPIDVRDSLPLTFGTTGFGIPIREEWVGARAFSVYVRDAAGHASAVYSSAPDSFQIYPDRVRPTRTAELEGAFMEVVLDPVRDRIYLAQPDEQSVAIVPLGDLAAVTTIPLDGDPRPVGLDLSPDGAALAVAFRAKRALAFIDPSEPLSPPTIVPLTALGEEYGPAAVRYLPDGSLMVQMSGVKHSLFLHYDPGTGTQTVRGDTIPTISYLPSTARTPDYARIGFNLSEECALVYDAVSGRFSPCRRLQWGPSISVSDDGTRFAKAYEVYDAALSPLWVFPPPYFTYTTGITPDGRELYVSSERGLMRVRIADGDVLERTPLPPVYNGRIIFARNGRLLLAIGREPEHNAERTRIHAIQLD